MTTVNQNNSGAKKSFSKPFTPKTNAGSSASFGSKGKSAGSESASGEQFERKTSHYVYTLETDPEGGIARDENNKAIKNIIKSDKIQVYRGKFDDQLTVVILDDLPAGRYNLSPHVKKENA